MENGEESVSPSLDPFAGTNCTPPAIEEFPRPIIPQYVRAKGGLLVHLMIAAYMFLGLSIVCDDYFVPALERMVECTSILQKSNLIYLVRSIKIFFIVGYSIKNFQINFWDRTMMNN